MDSVGDIDDIDGNEHISRKALNFGMIFDFYCIEQVEPDVAKMQWMPENELDFVRTRSPFYSGGTVSGNIVSELSVEACDQRPKLEKTMVSDRLNFVDNT